jgi:hypothetical protein
MLRWGGVLAIDLVGLVLLYVGERLIGSGSFRWLLDGAGLLLVLVAFGWWLAAWATSAGENRRAWGLVVLLAAGGLAALGVYLLGSELVLGVAPVAKPGEPALGWRQIAAVLWPALLVVSLVPLMFVQWSLRSMGSRGAEPGRVRSSATSGAVTAVLLCTLFLVNAIAARKDLHTDLSYFKTTSPSEATRSLVTGLDQDTQALLFFPPGNDVLAEVAPYFEELASLSARLQLKVIDRAVAPELVKTHKVTKDGMVVLARGENRQTIDLGVELEQARLKLRRLDTEAQTALLRLARKQEVIYFTSGHGERSADRMEGDPRPRLTKLKQLLTANNFVVKGLGVAQGLASAVPDDAAMVFMIGPSEPLLPGELEALQAYLARGGHFLLMLDPGAAAAYDGLLAALGLKLDPARLAHERAFLPISQTTADRYNIVTDAFSSHPAVSTVNRYSRDLPVATPNSGFLAKREGSARKVDFLVRSLPDTWADSDGDQAFGPEEKRQSYQLAAAISEAVKEQPKDVKDSKDDKGGKDSKDDKGGKDSKDGKNAEGKKDKPEKKEAPPEMRTVVLAQSESFADNYLPFYGNLYLLADVVKWLAGPLEVAGAPATEEDAPVKHTRTQDVVWFYLTIFAMPLIILGIGFGTRFGRGWGRRAGK